MERVEDPEGFLKLVQESYAHLDKTERKTIELKDGRALDVYSTSMWNEDGRYLARAWFIRDITERRRAEEALLESEERFRSMADGCPSIMWVTDAEGETSFINHAYREFFHTTCQSIQNLKWLAQVHPDDLQLHLSSFERAVEEQTIFDVESRALRADGQWRLLNNVGVPRISSSGKYMGLVGLSQDITERRQAEEALRESHQFTQSTIDALASHICVLDETGR